MEYYFEKFAEELLVQFLPILATFVVGLLVKLLGDLWLKFQAAKPDAAWELEQAANFAIRAAEKVGLTGALEEFADSKLDYALELAQKQLEMRGVKNIDLSMIRAAIEAALLKEDNAVMKFQG